MYAMIGTWRMALEGIEKAMDLLKEGRSGEEALSLAISEVENFPFFKSVGYGGLPNRDGVVELDAGFMRGSDLSFGAVGAMQDIKNPIQVAIRLSKEPFNNFLVGEGARQYAIDQGFEEEKMLTDRGRIHYENRLKEEQEELTPYAGHDTVGILAVDTKGDTYAGTSTSGLFMKHPGRIGDSPVPGGGYYALNGVGAASATGMGEDLMKGCISYEIVKRMERGESPQEACDHGINTLEKNIYKESPRDLSVIAIDDQGNFGAASNIEDFSFVIALENKEPTVYLCRRENGKTIHEEATEKWLQEYMDRRMAKLERK
ncbi:MAG: N(4)-(beta-N-acetylglucosaminyl)-L-asparaginase [Tissierellia bacterium]|nr:N(4)-(beta-N-acetylglucosaminyl)-L-asparaginase [Tissierellia bacterium]